MKALTPEQVLSVHRIADRLWRIISIQNPKPSAPPPYAGNPDEGLNGWCQIASMALCDLLNTAGLPFRYHSEPHHAWVTVGGWWLDITIGQFEEYAGRRIYFEQKPSEYHREGAKPMEVPDSGDYWWVKVLVKQYRVLEEIEETPWDHQV